MIQYNLQVPSPWRVKHLDEAPLTHKDTLFGFVIRTGYLRQLSHSHAPPQELCLSNIPVRYYMIGSSTFY